jgi:hypothetical protein
MVLIRQRAADPVPLHASCGQAVPRTLVSRPGCSLSPTNAATPIRKPGSGPTPARKQHRCHIDAASVARAWAEGSLLGRGSRLGRGLAPRPSRE